MYQRCLFNLRRLASGLRKQIQASEWSPHSFTDMICHRQEKKKRVQSIQDLFPPDRKWKNGVERCSWIGAREVVKSCKPVHISNILSKLPTAQRLIKGGGQRFLLHLRYSSHRWWTVPRVTLPERTPFFFKCANSLLEMRKRGVSGGGWRVEGSEGGLLCFKPHLYSKIWGVERRGSSTDSSESQSGLCIFPSLAGGGGGGGGRGFQSRWGASAADKISN